ncbi:hypothetical protein FH972_021815 [Carpinus fangiana]|uniref:Ion transport domain-containing protein n=1 Tax=Carpinus fangiana TaxID=176857 RepID=A0A5N6KSI6_9ROSI|nr:hypothetical protein FH972_021815 [Carpinus fangiana]
MSRPCPIASSVRIVRLVHPAQALSSLRSKMLFQLLPGLPRPLEVCECSTDVSILLTRWDVIQGISDPYSLEQLRAPRLNTTVVRPLVETLYDLHDISIVYCLLVNRFQFLREQSYQAHFQSVNTSRALLCEVLALKLLRRFEEESTGRKGLLLLANILIAGFEPFQNAPGDLLQRSSKALRWTIQDRGGYERQMTALEIAIVSNSKLFLSSPACQKVVDAIYTGRIIYTPSSFIDILPDHYKHKGISLYDPRKANLLNQYRLNVPRTRNIIEVFQFIVLLALFIWVMESREPLRFSIAEWVFCFYSFGWILDQMASILEHGWQVYTQNLWSFLDVTFCAIYVMYFAMRMHGLRTGSVELGQPALDMLAMGAPFLVPRLAFNIFSENLVFVSLRDMMAKFMQLTFLAVWSFTGFFAAMIWLSDGSHRSVTIGKWMLWVWFGLDGTGIGRSPEFHWFFGPVLMVAFAILGNTLFLTILVSTLSHSFSNITRHSVAEVQFRRAVLTFEGVKSDALFSYPPPFNLLALLIMLPLKLVLSSRWFHKVNVTVIRTINAPLLVAIALFERHNLWPKGDKARRRQNLGDFSRFHVHGDIQAVFEAEPPSGLPDIPPPNNDEEVAAESESSTASADEAEDHEEVGTASTDMTQRLESLEKSTKRVEALLKRVCDSMDDRAGATSEGD